MRNATPALVLSLAVGLLVAEACKKDDDTAPVAADAEAPPPPPAAADAAAPPTEPPPVVPPTPVPVTPTQTKDAGTTDAGKTDAGKTDGGATDAGTKPDAATTGGGNFQACLAKCQAALAGCLTPQPGKDGGLPTLGDPSKCNAARDACQAACKP